MEIDPKRLDELVAAARAVRGLAYAPYSHYTVGAAVLDASGEVTVGCNVENASYGLSMCAERAALFAAVSLGRRDAVALAISVNGKSGSPCGACRQVMSEHCRPECLVVVAPEDGLRASYTVAALLPVPFLPQALGSGTL